MSNLPVSLSFEGSKLSIIDHNGQPWLSAGDLARALGYSRSDIVSKLYRRNKDEFTDDMTRNTKTVFSEKINNLRPINETRIFSPRGCHLVAMFARTPKAKAFRRWVLDVLDGLSFGDSPEVELLSAAQQKEVTRLAGSISRNFRCYEAAQWAVYKRLRDQLDVSSIHAIPASQYEDAILLLQDMRKVSDDFSYTVYEAERLFFRRSIRRGLSFQSDKMTDGIKQLG